MHAASAAARPRKQSSSRARAGRKIAVIVDVEIGLELEEAQALPDHGVLDLIKRIDVLDLRPRDPAAHLEKRRQPTAHHVAVFVDGGGEKSAAMLLEPSHVIGAAA